MTLNRREKQNGQDLFWGSAELPEKTKERNLEQRTEINATFSTDWAGLKECQENTSR